jgi:hypothetical protein
MRMVHTHTHTIFHKWNKAYKRCAFLEEAKEVKIFVMFCYGHNLYTNT